MYYVYVYVYINWVNIIAFILLMLFIYIILCYAVVFKNIFNRQLFKIMIVKMVILKMCNIWQIWLQNCFTAAAAQQLEVCGYKLLPDWTYS